MSDTGIGQEEQEGLVPLFTLSPGPGQGGRPGSGHDDQRAVFQRHHTFGYDCRLDAEFEPEGGYNDSEPRFTTRGDKPRKLIGAAAVVVFLGATLGILGTQSGMRGAIGDAAGHFFGGSNAAVATAPTQTPTSDVLAIGTDSSPSPSANASPSPSATSDPSGTVFGDPSPSAATPKPAPTDVATPAPVSSPTPAMDAPIFLTGTTAYPGPATCDHGTSTVNESCQWKVTIAAGNPLYAQLKWQSATTLSMTISTDPAQTGVLFTQQSSAGSISTDLASPPATVYITVRWWGGANTSYSLGLAGHSF